MYNAKVNENGAQINLDVSFGAVELYIPKTWNVVNNLNVSLGGVEENKRRVSGDENNTITVVLSGNVSLGGVEITYV